MKTSFSRTFFPAALILLAALLLVGASFQVLVRNLMTRQSMENLKDDCAAIAELASAYYTESSLTTQDFFVNLSIATKVSGADAVICDRRGRLVLCSDSPMGCVHQGMMVGESYREQVFATGVVSDVGQVKGLYEDSRYVVGMPILDAATELPVGLVVVSTPVTTALALLDKLADTYMLVSVLVVLLSVIMITFMAKHQSSPLRDMAKAASDFGHGHLDARVNVDEIGRARV